MKQNIPQLAAVNEVELAFSADVPAEGKDPQNSPKPQDLQNPSGASRGILASESNGVTEAQMKAIELLVSGKSVVDAALAAGVGRTTLYRWMRNDAAFVAAYNEWQQGVIDTARGRLLSLSHLAVTAVEKSLEKADVKTAMKVLEKLGVLDRPEPGPTDPAVVERKRKMELDRASSKLFQAELDARLSWTK